MEIINIIIQQLNLKRHQVENVIKLKNEGSTIPFIARYRKELTGNLDENLIRDIFDKYDYLVELEDRKQTILNSIKEQGKLTDELKHKIENCLVKNELEDLYLPYKPKKRTKATIAKERGLEPFANEIKNANINNIDFDLVAAAKKYINSEKGINTEKEAIDGATDIIAEEISEIAELRKWLREYVYNNSILKVKFNKDIEIGITKFENYRNYSKLLKEVPSHSYLAIRRGEKEEILTFTLDFDEDYVINYFEKKILYSSKDNIKELFKKIIKDSFSRLIKNSIVAEVRLAKKEWADEQAITVFEANLRQILLSAPAGMKPTLGIDPGFRTGCKIVILDETGKLLDNFNIYPFSNESEANKAKINLIEAIKKYNIQLIAIGNGTASRETSKFVNNSLNNSEIKPKIVIVNESGASIYSASEVAQREFPDYDLTVRGAVSIGRRLMDPLAELVKIDPKSIGVGQYQHDVDQKLLKKKLEETVISCVNYVGVDLNTASAELLSYVSGINQNIAKNIIEYRNKNGKFKNRNELLKVPKFGDKTFQQSAGFLRITNGDNPLDNTAVHPESYFVVEKIAQEFSININELISNKELIKKIIQLDLKDLNIGEYTLNDIISELEKPGRDPREKFEYADFNEKIKELKDLKTGMELEGVVTNITNFGCFVDIGVHQDGLVHISEMSNQFVKDPTKIVKVGQVVKVKVLEVNENLKQIKLSMRITNSSNIKKENTNKFSLDDLKNKFTK